MFDISFEDEHKNKFMYTAYSAENEENAIKLWNEYVQKHFNETCNILKIRKVI